MLWLARVFASAVTSGDYLLKCFRNAAHYCVPVGDERFVEQIAAVTGGKVGYAARGRPRKILGMERAG